MHPLLLLLAIHAGGMTQAPEDGAGSLPPVEEPPSPLPTEPGWTPPPPPAGSQPLADDVVDQLIFFDASQILELRQAPMTVKVGGRDITSQAVLREVKTPVLGRFQRPLKWTEFFQLVGRKDLAREQASLSLTRSVLELASLGMQFGAGIPFAAGMVVGLALVFWDRGAFSGLGLPAGPPNPTPLPASMLGVGVILAGSVILVAGILLGTGLFSLARALPATAVSMPEILALADGYNARVTATAQQTQTPR